MSELRIRELRRRKGWTQQDLADRAGIGQDTISALEIGNQSARPPTLRKLAQALDVDVEELFEEELVRSSTTRRLKAWKEKGGVL